MALVKLNKETQKEAIEKQPGSGKLWKNEITVPKPPKLAERSNKGYSRYMKPLASSNT